MFADLVFSKLTFFEQDLHTSGLQGSPAHEQKNRRDQGQGVAVPEGMEPRGAGCAGRARAQAWLGCAAVVGGHWTQQKGRQGGCLGTKGDTGSLCVWGATRRLK